MTRISSETEVTLVPRQKYRFGYRCSNQGKPVDFGVSCSRCAKPAAKRPERLSVESATPEAVAQVIADRYNEVHAKDENPQKLDVGRFMHSAETLLKNIRERNADGLISTVANGVNPGSLRAFEALTGIRMPSSQREQRAAIDRFCGITPEARAKMEAERERAAREREEAERRATALAEGKRIAKETRVRKPDGSVTTVQRLIEDGWTVKKIRRGATWHTSLVAPDDIGYRYRIDSKAIEYIEDFAARHKNARAAKERADFEAKNGVKFNEDGTTPWTVSEPGVSRRYRQGPSGIEEETLDAKAVENELRNSSQGEELAMPKVWQFLESGGDVSTLPWSGKENRLPSGAAARVARAAGVSDKFPDGKTAKPTSAIVNEVREKFAKNPAPLPPEERAAESVERAARALEAMDTAKGQAAMEDLRKAIEDGGTFPSAEAVKTVANYIKDPARRERFVKNMDEWREYASTASIADTAGEIARGVDASIAAEECGGVFVFPDTAKDAGDITQDQMILQGVNDTYRAGNVMGFLGCGDERLVIESRFCGEGDDYFFQYRLDKVLDFPNIVDFESDANQNGRLFNFFLSVPVPTLPQGGYAEGLIQEVYPP